MCLDSLVFPGDFIRRAIFDCHGFAPGIHGLIVVVTIFDHLMVIEARFHRIRRHRFSCVLVLFRRQLITTSIFIGKIAENCRAFQRSGAFSWRGLLLFWKDKSWDNVHPYLVSTLHVDVVSLVLAFISLLLLLKWLYVFQNIQKRLIKIQRLLVMVLYFIDAAHSHASIIQEDNRIIHLEERVLLLGVIFEGA